jgi:hypothetical protein
MKLEGESAEKHDVHLSAQKVKGMPKSLAQRTL